MLLTRIWSALLALLATALLAAYFLIPLGLGGDFTEAERSAIRGVTDGGLVAFEADIASSPVSLAPALLNDTRLRSALEAAATDGEIPEDGPKPKAPPAEDDLGADANDLPSQLIVVANEELLNQHPLMSVGLVDDEGTIVATTGLDERLFEPLTKIPAFKQAAEVPEGGLFSAALDGKLYAVKISRKLEGHRLVALEPLDLGGTSFLRRVLGSNPAGLVRDGELLGDPIGGASASDLLTLVQENTESLPPEGASQAVMVGSGPSARIGAIGRVPGPAGKGDSATIFAVLSQDTLSTKHVDATAAIQDALDEGKAGEVPWPIVLGVGVLALAFALWLPGFEGVTPQRRLAGELSGLAQGTQKQIFHEAYGGVTGQVARNAAAAHEALRGQVAEEIMAAEEEGEDGDDRPRRRPITRSTRSLRAVGGRRRTTRRNKPVKEPIANDDGNDGDEGGQTPDAIELPDAPEDAAIESHSQAAPPKAAAPASSAPAPTLSDEVQPDDSLMGALGSDLGGGAGAPPPPRPPAAPPPAAPPRAEPDDDPREAYFREIYDEFVSTKQACGENVEGFTYEKFARKLRKNTADLMKRPGTKDVQFSVYVKDGKAALKAKVVKE